MVPQHWVPFPLLPLTPAQPSWLTLEMGDTSSDSTLMRGLYTFCLAKPGSITYTMPSMVSDVSAMLVDTTILRPGGPPSRAGGGACMGGGGLSDEETAGTCCDRRNNTAYASWSSEDRQAWPPARQDARGE